MLITIKDHQVISLIDKKSSNYSSERLEITLFDVIDDLLAIDWLHMAAKIFNGIEEKINSDSKERYIFENYDSFIYWLKINRCLYKDTINHVTFQLIQEQFPVFDENTWGRFYNAILLLNLDDLYNGDSKKAQLDRFNQLFPKKEFFSPFANIENEQQNALIRFTFSSNLEMIVYDIVKDIYFMLDAQDFGQSVSECDETFIVNLCDSMLNQFDYRKKSGRLLDEFAGGYYAIEAFINDNFIAPWFREIDYNSKTYKHIELLYDLLKSNYFFSRLSEEYRKNNQNQKSYGQSRLTILDFINADIVDRFEIRNYIAECYSNYEVKNIDIYNFHDNYNVALLLILYALTQSSLSFAKCEICGQYFVRNLNNKSSSQCIRCNRQINASDIPCDLKKTICLKNEINALKNEAKQLQNNSNKAINLFEKNTSPKHTVRIH